jgi:hypothetical protein
MFEVNVVLTSTSSLFCCWVSSHSWYFSLHCYSCHHHIELLSVSVATCYVGTYRQGHWCSWSWLLKIWWHLLWGDFQFRCSHFSFTYVYCLQSGFAMRNLTWLGLGQLFRAWLPLPLVANYLQMLWKGGCCVISYIDGCHELFVCAKVGSWELILNFANIVFWHVGCGDRWCSQEAQINQVPQNLRRVPDNHIQCWIVRQHERAFCPMCCSCRRLYGVVLSWSKPLKMSCAGSCSPWSVFTL